MTYIYELFISDKVCFEQVARVLSDYANISSEKIGTMDECIDKFETEDEIKVAMDIYYYLEGYKTYVDINYIDFEFKESQITELACKLAVELKSNVALADDVDCGEFNYIIISPDRKYQKAYEMYSNTETLNFTTHSDKADISEYLSIVDKE